MLAIPVRQTVGHLRSEFDRLFESALGDLSSRQPVATRRWPVMNLWEDDSAYHIEAEVPGLTKEQVELSLENSMLTIKGEYGQPQPPAGADGQLPRVVFLRLERPIGVFTRSIRLADDVSVDEIAAELQDGVLRIRLPKQEQARPRRISVSTPKEIVSNG
jgi:HSP20 family protein